MGFDSPASCALLSLKVYSIGKLPSGHYGASGT